MHDPVQAFRGAILAALGHAPDVIEPGKLQRFPTRDRRGDDAGWCRLFPDLRGGVFGCYRQGISEVWSATDRAAMTRQQRAELARQVAQATAQRQAQQRQQWAINAERNARLWTDCRPLTQADVVTRYLRHRGIVAWPLPECLRLHPALPYWHEGAVIGTFLAMVAPLVAHDGRVLSLHRTFLSDDGKKADVPTVKKLTAASGSLAGACIPLFKPLRGTLGISEGVETALAAWCASGVPTVAAYSAGNMAAWRWPAGVRNIIVFGDNDDAGRKAADELRVRALAAGLRCEVMLPTEPGTDWADVWAARGVMRSALERAAA